MVTVPPYATILPSSGKIRGVHWLKLHNPPRGLFGCVFYLHKSMHLWSGTFPIFTSLTCTNHKTMQNYKICAFSQFSKDLRSLCCIKILKNSNPMVLTLQTIEYIKGSYPMWLVSLHFINKNLVWSVVEQFLSISKTHFSTTLTLWK